jgi:uncharacterized protein (DUF362 family)
MSTATVALTRCDSYSPDIILESVRACFSLLGGLQSLVFAGERILLKPNLVTSVSREVPACTHPEVVAAVGRLVQEAGAYPFIGDSPAFGTAQTVSQRIGLMEAASRYGIPIKNLGRPVSKRIELGGREYRLPISSDAIEADGIINLPKFKSHRQATLTFGVKNLYGCVPGKRKACRHFASGGDRDWFSNMLVANAFILAPRLTLVDAIVAMEGQGPVRGSPRSLNCLVTGTDTVAVDTLCCRLIGFPPLSLCTQKAARQLGVGVWDPSAIEVRGDELEQFMVSDFRLATEIPIFFSLPQLARSLLRSWRERLAPE